ncbi:2-oxoglutarate and iron-dependent oxygenase domain-containing protein 3 isoform X6 [Harpia harpyja]|uniref:2-oxoglutarate and iron-dependent oxygenase domain-containing protein 3 isoform X6 n=1 Tax=Harpia harpyja TaxID=202280 RepID=UPI0022B10B28|nr:2-oxoglutarate and iron-dependent oxygenase domain-containing protein 3 isoform X6 [Harpia harpyja]
MPPLRPRLLPTARSRLAAAPPGSIDWFGLSPRYPGIKRFAASLCLGSGVRALSGRCHLLLSALASPPLPLSAPQGIRPARSSEALLFGGRLLSPGRRERRAEHVALCLAGAMAPQRRAAPRGPESGGTAGGPGRGGRRHSSAKKSRGQQESRWRWLKAAVLLFSTAAGGLLSWSYLRAEDGVTEVLARHSENLQDKFVEIPCSEDYDSHKRFEGCTPRKCGRGVTDAVITREEAERIRSDVRQRIQQRIAQAFGISSASMYLTKPTFFSRINNTEAKTTHDEYWHPHVDKVTYGSFDYTSLLYLSDYTEDFGGGRFVFMDAGSNKTIEPRAGRVSFFTSGSENLHRVEKVHWGTRYAITISFTCNPDHGIGDPVLM